ncbi:hypothetical protein WMY93_019826 [Mugilogobius chulae]|uniref:Uncharacterized protein n=1 Tax=Mugilogobius chulae TaxID=88201 RepID=A0AAW0NGR6_9GOBI
MDKAFVYKDLKNQLSTSRVSNDSLANNNGSDTRLSILASLSTSLEPISPSQVFSVSSINEPDTDICYLAVPPQGKSSTPQLFLPKQKIAGCDQSFLDLVGSQISWDVSIIKSENPKVTLELSATESSWSPKPSSSQEPDTTGLSP